MRIESAIVSAASTVTTRVEQRHGQPRDARRLLVERDGEQAAQQHRDRRRASRGRATRSRRRSPRVTVRIEPNRYWKRFTLSAPADETSTTPAGDPGVEDDRERLVAGGAAAGAQPLDRDRADHGCDERRQHRRDAEQVAGRDAREGDVADAVADQAQLALHEEEADRGREHAHDRAGGEREPHELELKHAT